MNLVAFQRLRNGLQLNAAPATSQVRRVLEVGLRAELLASGVFDVVEVGRSDESDRLVLGLCTYSAEVTEDEVRWAVERAWSALAFHHWQAHAFLTDEGHVELQAATLDRPAGRFVTVHVVAQRAEAPRTTALPSQRRAHETAAPALAHSA
jgi:hypothetical protein